MKSPVPPFLERIQTETRATRERMAGELFGLDAVRGAVASAAAKGLDLVALRPPLPVDLRETQAARTAVKHLRDSGFSVEWESYMGETDGRRDVGWELRVTW